MGRYRCRAMVSPVGRPETLFVESPKGFIGYQVFGSAYRSQCHVRGRGELKGVPGSWNLYEVTTGSS